MRFFAGKQSGVTLIEVVVGITIVSVMVVAVGYSVTAYVAARAQLLDETKSLYLVEEGYEMLRALREDDWNTIAGLTIDQTYYFDVSTTSVSVSGAPEIIDTDFRRSFVLTDVYRDNDDDVTASTTAGATIDPETVEATVYVNGPTGTSSMKALLTNLHAI